MVPRSEQQTASKFITSFGVSALSSSRVPALLSPTAAAPVSEFRARPHQMMDRSHCHIEKDSHAHQVLGMCAESTREDSKVTTQWLQTCHCHVCGSRPSKLKRSAVQITTPCVRILLSLATKSAMFWTNCQRRKNTHTRARSKIRRESLICQYVPCLLLDMVMPQARAAGQTWQVPKLKLHMHLVVSIEFAAVLSMASRRTQMSQLRRERKKTQRDPTKVTRKVPRNVPRNRKNF